MSYRVALNDEAEKRSLQAGRLFCGEACCDDFCVNGQVTERSRPTASEKALQEPTVGLFSFVRVTPQGREEIEGPNGHRLV